MHKTPAYHELFGFLFADALDLAESLLGGIGDRFDREEAGLLQLFDVAGIDAVALCGGKLVVSDFTVGQEGSTKVAPTSSSFTLRQICSSSSSMTSFRNA